MRLFRAKITFKGFDVGQLAMSADPHTILKGQVFIVEDETDLPDPRAKYPGNLRPYWEEIVPSSILVRQFSQIAKTKEL